MSSHIKMKMHGYILNFPPLFTFEFLQSMILYNKIIITCSTTICKKLLINLQKSLICIFP